MPAIAPRLTAILALVAAAFLPLPSAAQDTDETLPASLPVESPSTDGPAQDPASDEGYAALGDITYVYERRVLDSDAFAARYEEPDAQEIAAAKAHDAECKAGSMSACYALAEAYQNGEGVPRNRPIAAVLLAQTCNQGLAEGCLRLGHLYSQAERGSGRWDSTWAFEWACQMGLAEGCREYAAALRRGYGVDQDEAAAEKLLQRTCDSYDSESCRILAASMTAEDRSPADFAEGVRRLDALCAAGNDEACSDGLQAFPYDEEEEQTADPKRDLQIARFSHFLCANDSYYACYEMGKIVLYGTGVPADRNAAEIYYERACRLAPTFCDHFNALRGETTNLYDCEAFEMDACVRLARAYAIPETPIHDPAKTQHFFDRACTSGNIAEACRETAFLLLEGPWEGREQRNKRAKTLLDDACNQGDVPACSRLADELLYAGAFERDADRATAILRRLCDLDLAEPCARWDLLVNGFRDTVPEIAEADETYMPPLEFDEQGNLISEWAPATMKSVYGPSCFTNDIEFRGQTYSDTLCRTFEYSLGSYRVRPGQAPWQALLWRPARLGNVNVGRAQRVHCGGSLVARGWILTAAHCLVDQGKPIKKQGHRIRLGVYNPRKDEGISYPIEKVFPHPRYNKRTYAYDIALVKFDPTDQQVDGPTNSIFRIRMDQSALNDRRISKGMNVYSYGWGWTEANNSSSSDYLQGVKLQLEDPVQCTKLTAYRGRDEGAALCAAGEDGAQTCYGDSGGPLITYGDPGRVPTVIAVVSWGRKCGTTGKASAFTRVAKVNDWIKKTLRKNR